ncbi:MAG: PQQ-binding-like beta-propeller repeat protein [Candidatus Sungiibacteriota bacterium]
MNSILKTQISRHITTIVFIFVSLLFVLAPAYAGALSWPQFQQDASHKGEAAVSGPSATGPTAQIIADLFLQGGGDLVGPIVTGKDGDVIVPLRRKEGAHVANIYVFAANGSFKWKSGDINLPGFCCGFEINPVVTSQGDIFFVNGTSLIGLHSGGSSFRTTQLDTTAAGSKIVLDSEGAMFVVHGTALYAVNPDGSIKWKSNTLSSWAFRAIPAVSVADDQVYVLDPYSTDYGSLRAYARSTGALNWQQTISGLVATRAPVITSAGFVLVQGNTSLFAFAANQTRPWARNLGFTMRNAPLVRDNGQIIIADKNQIITLDGSTGATISTFQMPSSGALSQAVMDKDGMVYVGQGNKFYGISLATNQIIWSTPIESSLQPFHALGDDGTLYLATSMFGGAHLIAINGAPPKPDPVIIIPGILGSEEKDGKLILQPRLRVYDGLKQTLLANGYVEGETEFDFPYNWRQSNVVTAQQLRDKINEIKVICGCGKVDVIGHSMGGLVARQYIQSNLYQGDIDQLIFLGTPHIGAPQAYFVWEGGTTEVRFGIWDLLLNALLRQESIEAGFGNFAKPLEIIFNYIHNPSSPMLSLQELLPVYDYLKDFGTDILRDYPNGYPQNAFLENINKTSSLSTLEQSGISIMNIFSDTRNDTTGFIRVQDGPSMLPLWEHGVPMDVEEVSGDKTVPLTSSSALNVANVTNLNIGGEHRDLPANASREIVEILTGQPPTTVVTISPIKKLLSIFGLSPIDILVTAPDGKRIGKDFATGQEVNEIDGAFYTGFNTPNENISIPNPLDGEYKVKTQGTGSGSYTVAADYMTDDISVAKDFTAQTLPGLVTEVDLTLDNANPDALEVKPKDITPPIIEISSPQPKDYLRSEVLPLSVGISDSESGLFSSEIKFDDRIVNNGDIIDLFFEKPGAHKVSASASDFVGNATTTEVNFRIAVTIESTISDVERAYSLGWITKKSTKENLTRKLQHIIDHNREVNTKTLKTFIDQLEREHPKNINEPAYQLLAEDINWLLNN